VYGAEYQVISQVEFLDKEKFNCYLILFEADNETHSEFLAFSLKKSFKVISIHSGRKFDVKAIFKLRTILREKDVEIAHAHGYKSIIFVFLATRFTKIKLVTTLHGWVEYSLKLKLYNLLAKICLFFFDRIITVSGKLLEETKHYVGAQKVVEIRNAIDFKRFIGLEPINLYVEFNIDTSNKIVLYAGRLSKEKGLYYLIQTMYLLQRQRKDVIILILGDGEIEKDLKNFVSKLCLEEKIIFSGWREDILGVIKSCSIFILPSLTEGLPLALMEAMFLGKPIISTDVGGIRELVEDNTDGILVKPKDIFSIRDAICRILDDKELSEKLANNAAKKIRERFDFKGVIKEYENIYVTLLLRK